MPARLVAAIVFIKPVLSTSLSFLQPQLMAASIINTPALYIFISSILFPVFN
jgi:hypothetical protein